MMTGKLSKTEGLLLVLTGLFLCALLVLAARDRARLAAGGAAPEISVPQESFLPEAVPLDLNTATAEELTALPGIGPALAERIAAYRTEHGPFSAPEELMEVPGIGEAKYAALEGRITVNGEDT